MLLSDTHKIFIDLLRVSISRRDSLSHVPSAEEWISLYALSVKQALAGVCFVGVQRLPKEQREEMSKGLMMQWFALAEQIGQRNEVMNRRCVELQRMLEKEGMKGCILKGQSIAELYNLNLNGESNLGLYRLSGDIDVWVDAGRDDVIGYGHYVYEGVGLRQMMDLYFT